MRSTGSVVCNREHESPKAEKKEAAQEAKEKKTAARSSVSAWSAARRNEANGWGGARNVPCSTRLVSTRQRKFPDVTFCPCGHAGSLLVAVASAQQPVTRGNAVAADVERGARAAVARADTLVGAAQLLTAPGSGRTPPLARPIRNRCRTTMQIVDLPIDLFGVRSAGIGSAQAGRLASQYRFDFERAAAALDADTTYTRALAAQERVRLSRRNARDADSLRRMAVVRRDAGDASELDVLLATVNAGQAANLAAADSLTSSPRSSICRPSWDWTAVGSTIAPVDSLALPPPAPRRRSATSRSR